LKVIVDRVKWFRDRANRDRAVEQKELVDVEFARKIKAFEKNTAAWKMIDSSSVPRSGQAAYTHLKELMYAKLAEDCRMVHLSAPGHSEKDRVAEEAATLAELRKKGLLNQQPSDSWKVRSLCQL
jgi:hypothetical protein